MSWEAWTTSGRLDSYQFVKLPLTSLNDKSGTILKNVTGCDITWDWGTTARVSGTLDVVNTSPLNNCYIRIYYTPTLPNGKKKKIELATCLAFTQNGHYEAGKYSGRVALKSPLVRYTEDRLYKHKTLAKGKSALAAFKAAIKEFGGSYSIEGVKDVKFSKTRVVKFGSTVSDYLNRIASTLNCTVSCDTHGRVVLQKKVSAAKRSVLALIPTGERSVVLPGVDISSTWQTTPNRYAVMYHTKDKDYFARAQVSSAQRNFHSKIGRYITVTDTLSDIEEPIQSNVLKAAKEGLGSATSITPDEYTFSCYYLPLQLNRVYHYKQDKINIDGIVRSIDMHLGDSLTMDVTLRKVRDRK